MPTVFLLCDDVSFLVEFEEGSFLLEERGGLGCCCLSSSSDLWYKRSFVRERCRKWFEVLER